MRHKEKTVQGDWEKKLWLSDRLVWTVMGYGMELGLGERGDAEDERKVFEVSIFEVGVRNGRKDARIFDAERAAKG